METVNRNLNGLDDFLPERLAAIVHWRNDPAVNRYVRQGIRTLDEG